MTKLNPLESAVVTVLGTGYSPVAPATVASAAVCAAIWFVPALLTWPWFLLVIPLTWWGALLSRKAMDAFDVVTSGQVAALRRPNPHQGDPDQVVFDELNGQWITLIAAYHTIAGYAVAFVAFRGFDILKPLGIRWFETIGQRPRGPSGPKTGLQDDKWKGWGVMLDDVVAGIYGAIALRILHRALAPFLPGWYTGL